MRILAVLASMVLVSACTTSPTPTTSAQAPAEERILITGPDGQVSIATPDGGAQIVVERSAPVFSIQPTPSPDGTMVVHTGLDESGAGVAVVWTPEDRRRIDLGFVPFFYSWSPDGSRLAALGNGEGGVVGAIAEVETGEVTPIGVGVPHFVAWSPSGQRLGTNRDGARIDVVDLDGDPSPISQSPALFQAPEWLSDEELVVAVVGSSLEASTSPVTSGTARIVAVKLDGTTRDLLEVGAASQFDLDDGRSQLAVLDGPVGSARLRVLDVGSGDITELAISDAVGFEWSPNGERLLTLAFRGGELVPETWEDGALARTFGGFVPTATFVNEYLAFWGQYVRTTRSWAPDGQAFVYAAAVDGIDGVFVQRIDSDAPDRLVDGSMAQWLP